MEVPVYPGIVHLDDSSFNKTLLGIWKFILTYVTKNKSLWPKVTYNSKASQQTTGPAHKTNSPNFLEISSPLTVECLKFRTSVFLFVYAGQFL